MRCPQVLSKLSSFHDRELGRSEAEAVREHLLHCRSCRSEAAGYRSISRWLEPDASVPPTSTEFTDRVMDRIREGNKVSAISREASARRVLQWIAIAAGLVIGVSALYLAAPRTNETLDAASPREVEERIQLMQQGGDAPAPLGPHAAGDRARLRTSEGAGGNASGRGLRNAKSK